MNSAKISTFTVYTQSLGKRESGDNQFKVFNLLQTIDGFRSVPIIDFLNGNSPAVEGSSQIVTIARPPAPLLFTKFLEISP